MVLKPKHTVSSVAKQILEGLEQGEIVLDDEEIAAAGVEADSGPSSVPSPGPVNGAAHQEVAQVGNPDRT